MPEILPFNIVGMFSIDASDVPSSPIVLGGTVADVGVGDFNITLSDGGIDATASLILCTLRTGGVAAASHTSDTVKNILVFTSLAALVAADIDVDVLILRVI